MRYLFSTLCFLGLANSMLAQYPSIRGTVLDMDTQMELIGAHMVLTSSSGDTLKQSIADMMGEFRFEDISPGRYGIHARLIGFDPVVMDVEHISGRELILTVVMQEKVATIREVEVKAGSGNRGDAANEMATVSARRFSLEETNRYAGSRGDPARMASNYAGVSGTDDSRNDIVVRGNSPTGVLWRIDGLWIPNPNHFAIAGSQGGPVSVLNNKVLANSDFYTGAFPSEFGNSISSVFDLRFRNGNNEKYEFTAQLGILGTELTAEGPISKKQRSSFLVAYRYATFDLFRTLGMSKEALQSLIGTNAVPAYQDINFKLNFPIGNKTVFSVFGIGGKSKINTVLSDQTEPGDIILFGDNDRDQYFETDMGMIGATVQHQAGEKGFLQCAIGLGGERQFASHNYFVRRIDSTGISPVYIYDTLPAPLMRYTFLQSRMSGSVNYTHKFSARHVLKFGFSHDQIRINNVDSIINRSRTNWIYRWDYQGWTFLSQAYVSYKFRASDDLTITGGLHAQYYDLSQTFSPIEPRLGLKYRIGRNQALSAGIGLHSQIQPIYSQVYRTVNSEGRTGLFNVQMDMTKSWHFVTGYEIAISPTMRIKSEAYYQYLYDIPVEVEPSAFSLVNVGSGFSRFFPRELHNTGTGKNYGVELTIEKFFSRKLFFLLTGTVFNSRYTASDGVERNTDFNGNFVANGLIGSEFKIGERGLITVGGKITVGGGQRYGHVDTTATIALNELVYLDEGYNEKQFREYFRLDVKVNYRHNAGKVTHEVGLDLVNITDQENLLGLTYSGDPLNPIAERTQLGFLPILYYRIDF